MNQFDAAARRRLTPSKARDAYSPTEIYAEIHSHIANVETYHNQLDASRQFRELCQETLIFSVGMQFELRRWV